VDHYLAQKRSVDKFRPTKRRLLVLLAFPLFLQAQIASQGTVDIDGSKAPALIPDRDAYWMLFLHLSDGPGAFQRSDRVRYLKPSGLSIPQIDSVLNAANEYRFATDAAREKRKSIKASFSERPLPPAAISALDSAALEDSNALDATIQKLKASLDAEGRWRLKTFLDGTMKATMTLTKQQ
jgi:hypothetical protein